MSFSPVKSTQSLSVAVEQAMQWHQSGRLDDAERVYHQVLAQAPRHPDALHLLGMLMAQRRNFERAHDLISQAIAANPGEAMYHNNLANVCVERGLLQQAEAMYRRAIELDAGRLDALSNLGLLLAKTERPADAETLLRRAVELAPTNDHWRQNLANLYLSLGRDAEAIEQCYDGLVTAPRSKPLRKLLVTAYTTVGLKDKAAEVLRAWLKTDPEDAFPRHHLPAFTGEQVPDRAADAYLTGVFDSFALSFDAKLADLSYQAPQLVAAELRRLVGPPAKTLDMLDAGCGTGLCGPLLAPFARHLTGVDLSGGMLRKAVDCQLYDDLIQSELVAFLLGQPGAYDLLASADTLCYFGRLESFAAAARSALRGSGWLVFTVESLSGAAAAADFALQGHGRYSHSQAYVASALHGAGLIDVQTQAVVLRNEGGKPVDGWLVSARAPQSR